MEKLRTILLYADVTDGRMNEGSLRCDVNVSVRKKGATEYGTRTEMKNINSFAFASKAAEYEAKRQIKAIENGEKIIQETRRWDEAKGMTISMRSKEEAHDYRYFPEPDLMPIITSDERLNQIKNELPEMPDSRIQTYMKLFGITLYDGELLVASRRIADYYYEAASQSKNGKLVANWIISEIFSRLTEDEKESCNIPFEPKSLAELVNLIEENVISNSIAKTVFATMWETNKSPGSIVEEQGLKQMDNDDEMIPMVIEAIAKNEKAVNDFKNGKEMAIQAIVGYVMKLTKGKANPKRVVEMIKEQLNK